MGKPCRPGACASRIAIALVLCWFSVGGSAGNSTTSLPLITRAIDIRKMPVSEAKRGYPVRLKGAIDQAGRHRKRNRIAR